MWYSQLSLSETQRNMENAACHYPRLYPDDVPQFITRSDRAHTSYSGGLIIMGQTCKEAS